MSANPMETARAAWGEAMPDWVRVLAQACAASSQAQVAKELDRSGAVISQVLRKRYPTSLAAIEERVRGVYLNGQLDCPAMGALPVHKCQDWREKAKVYAVGNPLRTRMFRACRACPRFKTQKEAEE